MSTPAGPDSQGPRWEVFKQDGPDRAHQAVGSVHGFDAEHALLMARSVFARRPSAVSLWVAPADAVFSLTREQLASGALDGTDLEQREAHTYRVFRKVGQRRGMTFAEDVGEVEATGPRGAVAAALRAYGADGAVAWWVVPCAQLSASPADEAEGWFEPARGKTYKQQSAYGLVAPRPRSKDDA